ncbi:MAG: hypothetical protein J6X34_08305 [Clostridia bacterium]|nr:hypothetical protein [Clostridia bacterium]MBP5781220.1 hypothetical protein [Clostridia bacterium]MBR6935254.1 hypothetical protein [Clostridia bacterium]
MAENVRRSAQAKFAPELKRNECLPHRKGIDAAGEAVKMWVVPRIT